jgi:hypothetical protein
MSSPKCITDHHGNKRWYNRVGQLHRLGGPAIVHVDGAKFWYINGARHRLDGPAVEIGRYAGYREWWVNGIELEQHEFDQHPLVMFYRLCKEYA